MKTYHFRDAMPKAIFESSIPKVKVGYARHLLECVSRRIFMEGSAEAGNVLNRIADKTISEMSRSGVIDPAAFNALVIFEDKINKILEQLTAQYHSEKDPEAKKKIAKIVTSHRFLSNPSQDGILKRSLNFAKQSGGNRMVVFIRQIIKQILDKNTPNPIEAFKQEISHLQEAIDKYYYQDFPYQATIKPYKHYLMGQQSIINIMDKIVDNLLDSESEITSLSSNSGSQSSMDDVASNFRTNHLYESQRAFMEAFGDSLDYFAQKK